MAQTALAIYPKEKADSLSIAFRVFGRMAYFEDSLDITHRDGWLLYASSYDDIQHIAFIDYQPTYTSVYDTICSGEAYTWNGNTYSRPGVYVDTLQNIYGCDSIVELHLEVLPDPALTFTVNGVSFNMMRVRAGSFMMGATPEQGTDALANEKPAHQVTLTRDYFIAETMLTQELWTAVMGTTIQDEEAKRTGGEANLGYGPNYPMYCLSHNDCLNFVKKLNELTGLTFRMPTEAEWEYAARGGHLSKGYKYPGSNDPLEVAWSDVNAPNRKLREVKLLKPNELGVYDMAGNVWEYIYDYRRIYTADSQVDPIGDITTNIANIRGGSTAWDAEYSRVSYRHVDSNISKNDKSARRAFRFVLDADLVIGEDNKNYLQFDTICSGETYTWNGKKYYYSGTYTDTLQNVYGCDSIVELHLKVHPSYNKYETVVACGSYVFNPFNILGGDTIIRESGVYSDTVTSILGCDSIVTLNLTVMPEAVTTTEKVVIGSNELPYIWRNEEYSESATYSDIEKYALAECDSAIHILDLTVLTTGAVDEQSFAVCECALPYEWYGQTLTTAGKYTHTEKYTGTTIDSVQHILNFIVNKDVTITNTITACDSYTWSDGKTYTESGVYYDSLQTIHGCDSVEVLTLTINSSVVVPYTVTACDSYTWSDGNTYTESGVYYDSLQTVHGCDSVEVLYLTINNSVLKEYTVTECDSYTWSDGKTYTESGVYYDSLQTINGCDSVEILYLTISNSVLKEYTVTECDSYTWTDGNTYTESGVYYDSLQTIHGCDSIEVLTLTINNSVLKEYTVTACDSYTWTDGKTYTESGVYYDSLQTVHGCDSVEVLYLTINSSVLKEYTVTECDSYTWSDGKTYTESGVYYDSLQTVHGCDSVEVLYLTINNSVLKEYIVTECDSYTWSDGKTYTESGVYYDSLQTINGCDSVEVLYLTVNYRDTAYFTETVCDSYEWHGNRYTTSGIYYYNTQTVLGCDSVEVLDLTVKYTTFFEYDTTVCGSYLFAGEELIESGMYVDTVVNAVGCDSIVTLNLIVNPITPIEYVYDTICSDELPYIFNDSVYEITGVYTQYYQNQYGCDSNIVLMLEVVERLVVEVDSLPNLCADDGELVITFDVLQGEFDSLQIRFVNDTVPAELYAQTIYDNSISEVVYTFDSTIWVDSYIAQLEFYQHTSCGNQVFELPFDIQYDASIIVQKWDYFLALQNANYNGGYTFTDYQWYKNGEPIPGETGASLHQYLDSTAYYYAMLTRDDGLVMSTCDYRPNVKLGLPEFPTLVRVLQNIYVANTTYSAPIETITIYSELGQYISTTRLVNGEGNVVMPGIEGNYVVKIQTTDGQIISQLLIVLW